jgi:hypothetical protein
MHEAKEAIEVDAVGDAAFGTSGFKAAVFKPMFGQAHQAYFTPRWLCETLPPIAEHAFGFEGIIPEQRPRLNVIDPTAGSARLLAPFKERGHHVFGVELDARLAEIAGKAVGRRAVRQGDAMAYGPLIPESRWQVAAINPPYGLWWPVPESSPYCNFTHSFAAMARLCFQRRLLTNRLPAARHLNLPSPTSGLSHATWSALHGGG